MNHTGCSSVFNRKLLSIFVLLSTNIFETNEMLINLAYLRPTSRGGQGDGKLAVDGFRNSCMDSYTHDKPFWSVDLGGPFIINRIIVYDCINSCRDVKASTAYQGKPYILYDDKPGRIDADSFKYESNKTMGGRWVKLYMDVAGDLTFCEVEVMTQDRASFNMRIMPGTRRDGRVLRRTQVFSIHQCTYRCLRYQSCYAINVVKRMTSSAEMECRLLGPRLENSDFTQDERATYLEMSFE